MELKKSVATLEFVNKFLPSLLNFAFIKLFICSFDSLHSCSNFHQIYFLLRSSLGVNKLSFKPLTFFWVNKLEGSCNICQFLLCVFHLLNISSSFTMSPLQSIQSFKYKFFFNAQSSMPTNIASSSKKSHVSNPFLPTSSLDLAKPFININIIFPKPIPN